jgi:N6-adenosine-specific RNA methylase IME4
MQADFLAALLHHGKVIMTDIHSEIAALKGSGFACISADPAWNFKSNSIEKPGRNARRHYPTMSLKEIEALPVKDVIADDAVLFLWITGPFLVLGAHIPIMKAWGFKPSGMGFTWIKLRKKAATLYFDQNDIQMNGGFTTRKNAEFCLLGKRGKSLRKDAGVREVIISPMREHSRKPDEVFDRIEKYCDGPRLEMFARQSRPGWITTGNESTKFD